MGTFNLKEAAEQSLRLLARNGASAKTIKGYRNTVFGPIICHFTRKGVMDVNDEMLDAFLLEQREHFERGEFSEWKWRLVRRGSELLKHFAQTGTADLTEFRPWDPVLRKPRQSGGITRQTPPADPLGRFTYGITFRPFPLPKGPEEYPLTV